MMPEKPKRRQFNIGSLIGWLIFVLVVAGGPLINLARRLLGGTLALPSNLASYLPFAIGGLVVLSMIVSALRALNKANRGPGDMRLPTEPDRTTRPTSSPMPPFGGPSRSQPPSMPTPRAFTMPPGAQPQQRLSTPRFDPVINPTILAVGIVGLLLLGGAALLFFGASAP